MNRLPIVKLQELEKLLKLTPGEFVDQRKKCVSL